jgi:hypothetical protein
MSFGEQGDEYLLDRFVLTNNYLAEFTPDVVDGGGDVFNHRLGIEVVLLISMYRASLIERGSNTAPSFYHGQNQSTKITVNYECLGVGKGSLLPLGLSGIQPAGASCPSLP